MVPGLTLQELRLQINQGKGECYGVHVDGEFATGNGNGLRLTALFYLNNHWEEENGGELEIFPFPGAPLHITPHEGRMVILDPAMAHGVLPCYRKRFCFTLWLHKHQGNEPTPLVDAAAEEQQMFENLDRDVKALPTPIRLMFIPYYRFMLIRLLHCEMYHRLLQLSHAPGGRTEKLVRDSKEEIASLRGRLGVSPWTQDLYDQIQWPMRRASSDGREGILWVSDLRAMVRCSAEYWSSSGNG